MPAAASITIVITITNAETAPPRTFPPVFHFEGHSYQLVEVYKSGMVFPDAMSDASAR